MTSNAFEPKELVKLMGRDYPVVGGRLRLAHAEGLRSITTEIVQYTDEKAVIRATVVLDSNANAHPDAPPGPIIARGFTGYGEADATRDKRLKDAILELAETRAIARALRFAGFGVEFTGAEEVSHLRESGGPSETPEAGPRQNPVLPKAGAPSGAGPKLMTRTGAAKSPSPDAPPGSAAPATPNQAPAASTEASAAILTRPRFLLCAHAWVDPNGKERRCGVTLGRVQYDRTVRDQGEPHCAKHEGEWEETKRALGTR